MQMKGRALAARAPPPPFGLSVLVFSSGESQTGFHRESLQITCFSKEKTISIQQGPPLSLPLLSFPLCLSLPPSPFPPPHSPSLVYLSRATSVLLIYTH